ncbi:putative Quinon protein alcohol dehydrogenase-like superfamily [Seiridium unicorne]|uniref:Quinon protein alcohol dehydrogenase-like superfamily n=1 Tax=Seiridium unicorne TaxID=138068 RepID=A0ABR2VDS3_9PEZI
MRQGTAHASPLPASHSQGADGASQTAPSSEVVNPPAHSLLAATTLMSDHGQTAWHASGSLEITGAMQDPGDDHDMTDVGAEDGGAPLAETYSFTSDIIIPPVEDDADDSDTPWGGFAVDENLEGLLSLDVEHDGTTIASHPTAESAPPSPPLPAIHAFAQLPAFAQQVLSNIPIQQIQEAQFQIEQQQQLLGQQQLLNDLQDELDELHGALPMSNPNHLTLGPDNFTLVHFLRAWAGLGRSRGSQPVPRFDRINALPNDKETHRIEYDNLQGDAHDMQGVDWMQLGVTRSRARERRRATYKNYVNKLDSDKWHPGLPDRLAIPRDNYFRFRSMDIRRDTRLLHFQLRNILACSSRTRAFFPSFHALAELDPTTGRARKAMDFGPHSDVQVSTVAATDEILIAGSFLGDYRYRNLNSEDRTYTEGKLTDHISGITNHVQIHSARRSSAPIAAFASNDFGFRTVDLTTNELLFESMYNYPLNCSAISPDQRLRVMVGDHTNVLITDAETGEILRDLSGHRDFGFACDWAPDGWTVATGFQDKSVRIWDARRWTNNHDGSGAPIAVLRMDMSGARSLRFSPLGSGKRLLVAAEEADVINIFDAQTFDTEQKIETFGELGGTAFADDGRVLMALNCDPVRGGVMQFDRCDGGAEDTFVTRDWDMGLRQPSFGQSIRYDWEASTADILMRPGSLETMTERRRKAVVNSNLDPF